jgi:hypothetical protein
MKHFMGFSSGFTELHAKLDADTLLNFAIHLNETKHEVGESTCVKQCMFTAQCHVAD